MSRPSCRSHEFMISYYFSDGLVTPDVLIIWTQFSIMAWALYSKLGHTAILLLLFIDILDT